MSAPLSGGTPYGSGCQPTKPKDTGGQYEEAIGSAMRKLGYTDDDLDEELPKQKVDPTGYHGSVEQWDADRQAARKSLERHTAEAAEKVEQLEKAEAAVAETREARRHFQQHYPGSEDADIINGARSMEADLASSDPQRRDRVERHFLDLSDAPKPVRATEAKPDRELNDYERRSKLIYDSIAQVESGERERERRAIRTFAEAKISADEYNRLAAEHAAAVAQPTRVHREFARRSYYPATASEIAAEPAATELAEALGRPEVLAAIPRIQELAPAVQQVLRNPGFAPNSSPLERLFGAYNLVEAQTR